MDRSVRTTLDSPGEPRLFGYWPALDHAAWRQGIISLWLTRIRVALGKLTCLTLSLRLHKNGETLFKCPKEAEQDQPLQGQLRVMDTPFPYCPLLWKPWALRFVSSERCIRGLVLYQKKYQGKSIWIMHWCFQGFLKSCSKVILKTCYKEGGLSEIQHRNKQTCQHYRFNIGHVVRVFGIGTILILHLHSNDGASFLVLLEKERRGSLWFLIRRTKITVVLACRKDARVSDGVSSTRASSQSLQNIIKWLKLQSWHWQLQLTVVPKVKLEDSLLLQQAAVTAQQLSVEIIPTCGQRGKWIVLAWRGTTIGIRWSK